MFYGKILRKIYVSVYNVNSKIIVKKKSDDIQRLIANRIFANFPTALGLE